MWSHFAEHSKCAQLFAHWVHWSHMAGYIQNVLSMYPLGTLGSHVDCALNVFTIYLVGIWAPVPSVCICSISSELRLLSPHALTRPLLCLLLFELVSMFSRFRKFQSLEFPRSLALENPGSLRDSTGNRAIPWVHPSNQNKMLYLFTYYKFLVTHWILWDPVSNTDSEHCDRTDGNTAKDTANKPLRNTTGTFFWKIQDVPTTFLFRTSQSHDLVHCECTGCFLSMSHSGTLQYFFWEILKCTHGLHDQDTAVTSLGTLWMYQVFAAPGKLQRNWLGKLWMYFQCPGQYMVGTLSMSLQCICSVPAWYTTLCPQCMIKVVFF